VSDRPAPANDPDRTDGGEAGPASVTSLATLPSALPVHDRLGDRLTGELAVFLDYDGTLTPIVDDPDAALLPPATRAVIEALADATLVAIVSGRDLDDVRDKVGVAGIAYAGSHGFDILHPDGTRHQLATAHVEVLDEAERVLQERLSDAPGARVERKRFAIAVHDRQVSDVAVRERIAATVREIGDAHDELRVTGGKRIHELRPAIDWDKGRAIDALLVELGASDRVPIYLGDDLTDEDGFRAVVAHGGIGVVVRGEDDERETLAAAVLDTPDDARRFLEELRELVTGR
jgi:trehalose 6-phosphate phosphatase